MKKGSMIAVGVFAALLVLWLATAEREVSVGVKHLQVDALPVDAVSAIEVTGAQAVTLKKEGDGWSVVLASPAGKSVPADPTLVKNLLESLSPGFKGEYVSSRPEKLTDAEVTGAKALQVKVSKTSGAPLEFTFGRAANTGGTFVRLGSADDLFITTSQLPYQLRRESNAWRKHTFIGVEAPTVKKVTFSNHGVSLALNAGEANAWSIDPSVTVPAGFRADGTLLSRAAGEVTTVGAAEFVDAPVSDAALGFAGDHATVALETKEGKTVILHVGASGDASWVQAATQLKSKLKALDDAGDKDGQLNVSEIGEAAKNDPLIKAAFEVPGAFTFFAQGAFSGGSDAQRISADELTVVEKTGAMTAVRLEGNPQIWLVQPFAAAYLKRTLDDFRDLSLMNFDATKATRFAITYEGKQTVATKGKNGWQITEPKTLPAGFDFDVNQVEAQLNQFKNLHALGLAGDVGKALAKPTVTVEVSTDDKKTVALKIGDKLPGLSDFAATGNADALVYRLNEAQRQQWSRGIELFKKVSMPPNLGMNNIQGLDQLPPDVRRQIEAQLRQQQH